MSKTEKNPSNGAFVKRQYDALKNLSTSDSFSYYEMPKAARESKISLTRYFLFLFFFIKEFVFSKEKFDIMHVHFFFPTIILAIFYKLFRNWRVKIVVTFHGSDIYHYGDFKWWYRAIFKFVDYSIFVSDALKRRFFDMTAPYKVMCAGVLPGFKRIDNSDKYFDLIFVGHLDVNKGVRRLEALINELPSCINILVVGAGDNEKIKALANNRSNCEYRSYSSPSDLALLFNQSKWLISLSYNESFGLVMAEAMCSGTPVIATKTDGAFEQVLDGKNGYLIQQSDDVVHSIIDIVTKTPQQRYNSFANYAEKSGETRRIAFVVNELHAIYRSLHETK